MVLPRSGFPGKYPGEMSVVVGREVMDVLPGTRCSFAEECAKERPTRPLKVLTDPWGGKVIYRRFSCRCRVDLS